MESFNSDSTRFYIFLKLWNKYHECIVIYEIYLSELRNFCIIVAKTLFVTS